MALVKSIVSRPENLNPALRDMWERASGEISAGRSVCLTLEHRTRSTEANAKMWAMLSDVSDQVEWYKAKLTAEEWKDVLTAGLRKAKVVPGIDGGFVIVGQSTSKMTQRQIGELIELIEAFGAQQGVKFRAPESWLQ